MGVWTAITFAFGSILTSAKMTNMQANFEGMASGSSGAPRIYPEAMRNYEQGTIPIYANETNKSFEDASYTLQRSAAVGRDGVLGVGVSFVGAQPLGTTYVKVYVNSTAVGSEFTADNGATSQFSEAHSVSVGDFVQVWAYTSAGSGAIDYMRLFNSFEVGERTVV